MNCCVLEAIAAMLGTGYYRSQDDIFDVLQQWKKKGSTKEKVTFMLNCGVKIEGVPLFPYRRPSAELSVNMCQMEKVYTFSSAELAILANNWFSFSIALT